MAHKSRITFRERLSREQGTIIKDWGGRLPVALIYPNSYYVGMSNLGFQTIYGLLNRNSQIVCERVFWEKGMPTISIETQRPLSDFAVLAFSVSYELDYFNVVQVLKASGIPLYTRDRKEGHPVIMAGGPCVMANPMPLSPFFDCLCIGEAEAIIPAMLPLLLGRLTRDELIEALARLDGIYAPGHYSGKPVVRQWTKNLDDLAVTSVVLTPDTELGDLYLVEVERGCGWGCRFCLVCSIFSPMRFHSVDRLVEQSRRGLEYRKRIGLVGPAVSDHPEIEELLSRLRGIGAELAISSIRLSSLSDGVIRQMAQGGIRTITLAPEAGSERLRGVIKKGVSEEDIFEAIGRVAEHGMRQLKLYFMIGLPTETDDDIEEIVKLTMNAKDIIDRRQSGTRITINVSPFVPKANTSFQWLPMAPIPVLERRLSIIKRKLAPRGIKANYESPAWSQVQAVLSRGDVKVSEALVGMKEPTLSGWRRCVKQNHLDVDFYAHQRWDADQSLPWSVIDPGIKAAGLRHELGKALAQENSGSD